MERIWIRSTDGNRYHLKMGDIWKIQVDTTRTNYFFLHIEGRSKIQCYGSVTKMAHNLNKLGCNFQMAERGAALNFDKVVALKGYFFHIQLEGRLVKHASSRRTRTAIHKQDIRFMGVSEADIPEIED